MALFSRYVQLLINQQSAYMISMIAPTRNSDSYDQLVVTLVTFFGRKRKLESEHPVAAPILRNSLAARV